MDQDQHSTGRAAIPPPRPSHSPATKPGFNKGRRPGNAGREWPAETLTPAEVVALIRACSQIAPTGMRNRALIATLYRTGIKTGEAIALDATDVSFGDATLAVRGRDGRERILGVDPDALSLLGHWADARTKLGLSGGPLFSTLEGRPLAGSYIRTFLARLGKEVGLDKRVHPAGLRSTHAAELVDEGAPLTLIQAQLGLSSLSATERYLKDLNLPPVNRVKYLQDRHWRAKP